jgi:glycosyltransferase involved in cell wall biosynthesis
MIRIAVDTNGVYTTQAGVARYIRGLLGGLRRLSPPDLEVIPIAWEVENLAYRQPQRALKTFYRELIWAGFPARRRLRNHNVQILHATAGPLIRPPRGIKEIVTLHDLAVFRHPERFRPWMRLSTQRRLRQIGRADHVICISRFTADEAMALLNLPAARITVIHNGCEFHRDEPAPAEQKPGFAVPDEYLLFVGSLEPGKNLSLLREVYALAETSGVPLPPLLIVGARWEGVGHEGSPPAGWQYLGRQPDEALVYLYRHALGLAFPSRYEGFGFPVVEAMALGCPVICSPVASLPEVGEDAVLFTELTPAAYLSSMKRLVANSNLRNAQARKFSWTNCAAKVADVYRRVV